MCLKLIHLTYFSRQAEYENTSLVVQGSGFMEYMNADSWTGCHGALCHKSSYVWVVPKKYFINGNAQQFPFSKEALKNGTPTQKIKTNKKLSLKQTICIFHIEYDFHVNMILPYSFSCGYSMNYTFNSLGAIP